MTGIRGGYQVVPGRVFGAANKIIGASNRVRRSTQELRYATLFILTSDKLTTVTTALIVFPKYALTNVTCFGTEP